MSQVTVDMTNLKLGGEGKLRSRQVYAGDIDDSMSYHQLPTRSKWGVSRFGQSVFSTARGRIICLLAALAVTSSGLLFSWSHMSNSMSMFALAFLLVFDVFYLLTAAFSQWSGSTDSAARDPAYSAVYSFGYSRFEVLAVFSSVMLAQLGSFFIVKESVEGIFEPATVHTGSLPEGAVLAIFVHLLIIYTTDNVPFQKVIQSCSSSWLQEHVTDISETLCHMVPSCSSLLLPRINPLTLLGCASSLAVFFTHIAIDLKNYQGSDLIAAICIALFTIGTMYPLSMFSGKILLQTTPLHMISQIDKCIREACTLDGVLEFRNEHFWSIDFDKMAGSVHVRVRRDANDQLVLAHVYSRLANLVPNLTVQIFKDDWSRPSAYQIIQQGQVPPITSQASPSTYTLPPPRPLNQIAPINPADPAPLYTERLPSAVSGRLSEHRLHVPGGGLTAHRIPSTGLPAHLPTYKTVAPRMGPSAPQTDPSAPQTGLSAPGFLEMDESFVMVPMADKIPAFTSTPFGSPGPQQLQHLHKP